MKIQRIEDNDRIDRFIARLRLESRKVILRSELIETNGMVIDFDQTTMTILFQGSFTPIGNKANIQFMIEGDYYFAFVDVVRCTEKQIVLRKPSFLENRSARKYPRTYVNGEVFARFNIISDLSVERDINTANAPPKLSKIYFELQKNVPDIKKVFAMIGAEIKNISSHSEIKLHKEGEKYPEEVSLVIKYKKPFWIMETADPKNYIKEIPANDVINFSSFFKEMKRAGWNDARIREEILKRQQRYNTQKIHSVAVVPIKLFENVIGHILTLASDQTARTLRQSDIYYLMALADIASEALAKARLFKLDTGSEYEIPVHNISAGGAYLEVNSQYIIKFLQESMHLKTGLKFSGKEIESISEIRRIDFIGESVRLAIKFIEMAAPDQEFIENFVRKTIDFNKQQKKFRVG